MQTLQENYVPHLTTALTGPIQSLEEKILANQVKIESWFRSQWQQTLEPLYASVDLRNCGFKLAPVDTNLFPAGFNNLNPEFMPLCIQAMQNKLERQFPGCQRVLLIPEDHSRNIHYYENIATIQEILLNAGFYSKIGSINPDLTKATNISLPSGKQIIIEPITKVDNRVKVSNFDPCLVILNNDLATGLPKILEDIEQVIVPSPSIGWSKRLKSFHFSHYESIADSFAKLIDIDPWLINPIFAVCNDVDFKTREGLSCLAHNVDTILNMIKTKYQKLNIDKKPFVVIKAESGSYGMGVMMVQDSKELENLNRKKRLQMSVTKGGQKIDKVIIQEGVYTFETIGPENNVAEPVVYMIGHNVVGGFYRVHKNRSENENLNAPGMHFEPLAFVNSCNIPDRNLNPDSNVNRFYAYGVIARLALLAAAREIKQANSK